MGEVGKGRDGERNQGKGWGRMFGAKVKGRE